MREFETSRAVHQSYGKSQGVFQVFRIAVASSYQALFCPRGENGNEHFGNAVREANRPKTSRMRRLLGIVWETLSPQEGEYNNNVRSSWPLAEQICLAWQVYWVSCSFRWLGTGWRTDYTSRKQNGITDCLLLYLYTWGLGGEKATSRPLDLKTCNHLGITQFHTEDFY